MLKGQRRRPPSNSRKGGPGRRGTQWARGPRGRAWARLPKRKGKQRAGGGGGWPGGPAGPAAARAGGEAPAKERGFPTADPTKTQGNPGRARCGRLGREKKVAGSLLRATGRRHHGGGGSPFRPTRGRAASPPRPAPGPDDRGRPAGPRPSHLRQRRRWKVQGADRRAGTRQRGKLGSGMFRFTGLATRPSARAQEWPDERGPAAPVRPARRCARRVPPRASARAEPLGLSFLLPPALSLPEPGLIWSCWRQGVGAAQPPLLRCQYPAHSPARPLVCSHAHPRAAAAAARPGILSKFPAPPARARRWEARGPRGERPQPPAPLIPAGKTTRILASPCLLSSG